jgi:hypothetical protein
MEGGRDLGQRPTRVGDDQERRFGALGQGGPLCLPVRLHQKDGGAAFQRDLDEVVSVAAARRLNAGHGDEQ